MRIYEIPRNRAQRGGVFKREDSSMRVIGRRDLASGGEIQFPRGAEGELNSRETASAQKMFTAKMRAFAP
jgi:hypothetical protein